MIVLLWIRGFIVTVLEIFSARFPINLIPNLMGDVCVIMGFNWLSRFRALIGCDWQTVVIYTPSKGELTMYGESSKVRLTFCSISRANMYLHHGYSKYLAYVVIV